jgi:hypothetical protein
MLMQIPALSGVMRSSGIEYLGISKSGQIAIMKVKDASGHEHAANGQFGSGGSSAAKPKGKESQGAKRKRTAQARRAESAGQATLGSGKAIQTLLGGGSALDKIEWLKTSPKQEETPKEPEKPAIPGGGSAADVSDIFPRGVSGGIPVKGKVDVTKPYMLIVRGNTYSYKDSLKSEGFKYNGNEKHWEKAVTPPDKPNPYGGTLEENQLSALSSAISSAGRGKYADRALQGELVQGSGKAGQSTTTSNPPTTKPTSKPPDASTFSDREKETFDKFNEVKPGKALGREMSFGVAGKTLTHDRQSTIMLSRLDAGGVRLTLKLNNPYADNMGSEDVYRVDYPGSHANQAIKDYTYTVDNKASPSKNFAVFEREGHKWPGFKRG